MLASEGEYLTAPLEYSLILRLACGPAATDYVVRIRMMRRIEHVSVAIQDDFIARQTRAQPVAALAELIWNSLDGAASRVEVEFEHSDLAGGLSKIVLYDDGEGFPRSDAAKLFGNLGGSWKRLSRRTKCKDRMVHGQEGRGRYKAFALGGSAVWKVCYLDGGTAKAFEITLLQTDLKDVAITEEHEVPGASKGVTVQITDINRDFRVLSSDEGLQELAEIFALYLINYARRLHFNCRTATRSRNRDRDRGKDVASADQGSGG